MKEDACFVLRKTFLVIFRQGFQRRRPFCWKVEESGLVPREVREGTVDLDPCCLPQSKDREGPPTISFDKDSAALYKSLKMS